MFPQILPPARIPASHLVRVLRERRRVLRICHGAPIIDDREVSFMKLISKIKILGERVVIKSDTVAKRLGFKGTRASGNDEQRANIRLGRLVEVLPDNVVELSSGSKRVVLQAFDVAGNSACRGVSREIFFDIFQKVRVKDRIAVEGDKYIPGDIRKSVLLGVTLISRCRGKGENVDVSLKLRKNTRTPIGASVIHNKDLLGLARLGKARLHTFLYEFFFIVARYKYADLHESFRRKKVVNNRHCAHCMNATDAG